MAAGVPFRGWVVGHGWDANRWEEGPDRWVLDAVCPGPAYFDSLDVHAAWVNSAALGAAGIGRETPDPPGGRIVRDGAGEPLGLLLERAVELVAPHVPQPGAPDLLEAIKQAQAAAIRLGVTGIHNVEGRPALEAFRSLQRSGDLRLRVLFHLPVGELPA